MPAARAFRRRCDNATGSRPSGARVAGGEGRTPARAGRALRHPSRCDRAVADAEDVETRPSRPPRVPRHGSRPGGHRSGHLRSRRLRTAAADLFIRAMPWSAPTTRRAPFTWSSARALESSWTMTSSRGCFRTSITRSSQAACSTPARRPETPARTLLLQMAELITRYRQADEFERLLRRCRGGPCR